MPAPKRVTPKRVGGAAFAVVLAVGLTSVWAERRAEEADQKATAAAIIGDAPATTHDHGDHEHRPASDPDPTAEGPEKLGSDEGHGDVPLPTLPPLDSVEDPSEGQPTITATTTPTVNPDEPDAPRSVDPGPDPVAAPPRSDLFMAIKQAENQSMWLYTTVVTMEDLVAHYMGALNSGEWVVTDSRTLYSSPDSNAPVNFYEIFAGAPGKSATVRIHTNSYGEAQAQLEITYGQ